MKTSQTVNDWLQKKNLNIHQLLSIAFVPHRTAQDIMVRGERWIPAMYRLFLVTQLTEFVLSDEDQKQYQKLKEKKHYIATDELICTHFNRVFVETGMSPSGEDALALSYRNTQDKKALSHVLVKKYFKSSPRSTNGIPALASTLVPAVEKEFISLLNSEDVKISDYKRRNAQGLKQLKGLLEVLFDENPKKAFESLLVAKKIFS